MAPTISRTTMEFKNGTTIVLFFLLAVFCKVSNAQTIKGKIIDVDTKQPASFAIVIVDPTNRGTTADLDGNFEITLPQDALTISIQVIGYNKKTIPISELDPAKNNVIKLKANSFSLAEIIIKPAENPAIPIIRKVIINKPKFNINNLKQYICNTYAKTYFTFSDRLGNEKIKDDKPDSSSVGKLFKNAYLFFMESVTEKKYHYKNIAQEKVIASKVSGFKSAPFGAFASQLQSFTFYDDNVQLLGLSYLNPLSKGTFKRYNFEIIDTVLNNSDTTILIKFYPKRNIKFKALKGVLYINKNQYVLANVLAEPSKAAKDGTGIKIQQLYEKIDSVHWFPKQLNTEILFYGISSASNNDSLNKSSIIKGVSRMYVSEANVDSVFKIKHKSIASFNDEGFDDKKEEFWNKKRLDTLTEKEIKTYRVIDSIGKKANFDNKLKWLNALTTGQFQVGYFNIDLNRFLRVNDYEGIRLGAGMSTSDKLSRWYSVGGYGGYGFSDKAWKYGGYGRINFNKRQSTYIMAEGAKEVIETAGTTFLQENNSFISTEKIRDLLVRKMDKVSFGKLSFNTSIFNFIKASAYLRIEDRQSPFGIAIAKDNLLLNEKKHFTINETGVQLKIWPKEKFTESMGKLVSLGSKWPAIFINVARGLTSDINGYKGDFEYTKFDLRIDQQLNFKVKGFVSYQLQAGKVIGNVPYSLQYNNKSSRSTTYWISAEKTFETMYLNEFISTQYAAFFFAINTGKFIKPNNYFNPEIELVHNFGIGTLDNRQNLTNIELNDISKGYTETGIRIKSMYKSKFSTFGIGVYYRYGNYASDNMAKNFVYKLVLGYSL